MRAGGGTRVATASTARVRTQGNRKRLKDEVYLLYSSLERALKRRRGTEYH